LIQCTGYSEKDRWKSYACRCINIVTVEVSKFQYPTSFSYQIFNYDGVLLESANIKEGVPGKISIDGLPAGTYILKVYTENEVYSVTIICI
jgi:hypothetical protein